MIPKNKNIALPVKLYARLLKLSKFRGMTIPKLLDELIAESVDDCELMEMDYAEYTSRK